MKQIIDTQTWNRRDNFRFFSKFLNPCISITSEVGCGNARIKAKEKGQSFFIHYLYAILRATNEIDELRYRINYDGKVVLYDTVDVLAPVRLGEDGQFGTVRIPWDADFERFYDKAYSIIKQIPEDGDPYGYTMSEDPSDDSNYNVILVSATPDLYFTSITHTQEHETGSNYPLLNVGKAVEREGKLVMPIALCVHHGFVDGKHIGDFFKKVEEILA